MQKRLAKAIENFPNNLLSYPPDKPTHSQTAFHHEIQAMRSRLVTEHNVLGHVEGHSPTSFHRLLIRGYGFQYSNQEENLI